MERNELKKGRSNPVASCLYLDVDVVFPRFEKRRTPRSMYVL